MLRKKGGKGVRFDDGKTAIGRTAALAGVFANLLTSFAFYHEATVAATDPGVE